MSKEQQSENWVAIFSNTESTWLEPFTVYAAPNSLWHPCGAAHVRSWTNGEPTESRQRPDQGVLVELAGFEPAAPSLRTRCSARLSYSPRLGRELYR